jgi:hypothetical protein
MELLVVMLAVQLLCLGHIQALLEIEASENGFRDYILLEEKLETAAAS